MSNPFNILEQAGKLGISRRSGTTIGLAPPPPPPKTPKKSSVGTLSKYTGEWTDAQAAHLLRRTISGPTLRYFTPRYGNAGTSD